MEKNNRIDNPETGILSFDPIVLVLDVVKRWMVILLAVVVVGVAAYVFADVRYEPVYQTRTTFVVSNRSSSTTVYNNLSSATTLAQVFSELLNSNLLWKIILEELDGVGFDGSINAAMIEGTNLLTVTVTASSPRTAFLVAKTIIEHHETLTYQVVDGVVLEVLQWPTVPVGPINHADAAALMKKMMVLAFAGMCVLLAYLSFARDAVRSGKEANAKLDCDYLGEIPHERRYKTVGSFIRRVKPRILISNPAISFRYVEQLRKIAHRVEQRMQGGRVLMVTSTLENEGKSTISVNLALTLAQKCKRVLLIDCDLHKPSCHKLLKREKIRSSVRDVLMQRISPEEALIRDKKGNLCMLLGRQAGETGDLLYGEGMEMLMDWARANFDYVVLDLPPMDAVSDAETVMEYADASLLVVRQNAAVTRLINKNVGILQSGRANLLGCVVNNVRTSFLSSAESYGYGRYGSYGRYGKYGHYGHYNYYDRYNSRPDGDA